MVRAVILLLLTILPVLAPAQSSAEPFAGRPVADVLEEYRAQGWPFAYSSNLVNAELTVAAEPAATGVLDIVREILAPHGLTLLAEEGLWLVVRSDRTADRTGSLLVVARDRRDLVPLAGLAVQGTPALGQATELTRGVQQFAALAPGRYRLVVEAPGYAAVERQVRVRAGQRSEVDVQLEVAAPEIEQITVAASRYEIARDISTSRFDLDRATIESLPVIGDDPLRATHRLPGAAASGASARSHFRGGEQAETGIILNGQRLFDPFHIRDYQNIFSTVDARAIDGVEIFTGGFPVQYGDRLSGVVLMESLDLAWPRHTEIGVSVFNTSFLTAGRSADGDSDWLFSARRGNLDLVIDRKFGQPNYYDVFGQFSAWLTPNTRLSGNLLFADDEVEIVTESDPEELERAESSTRNAQAWLALDNHWSDTLRSTTVVSVSAFSNRRVGVTRDEEKVLSDVADQRDIDQVELRQDWSLRLSDTHRLQWGFSFAHHKARYDYAGHAEFFGLRAMFDGVPRTIDRELSAAPSGPSYGAYISDRWRLAPRTVLELGLRWDDQTYTELPSDAQLSPRLSVLHALNSKTELRLGWGRYYQSQGIHQLQIEDGVSRFFPAQQADHLIAGLSYRPNDDYLLRLELFRKDMSDLRPRFENLYDPLALIPELQPDRIRIVPSGALANGLELSLYRNGREFSWWASYSLAEVTDRVDGLDVPRAWDQRHALQAGLTWTRGPWDFSLAAHVRSGWPTTSLALEEVTGPGGATEFIAVPGPRNALRLSNFGSLDVRLSRRFDVGRGELTLFAEVANLTNRKNVCCLDYDIESDDDGNEVLEYSEDYWLPLLPAVGFLWEF